VEVRVDAKEAKREFFKIRGRFLKLQRTIIGEALTAAAAPIAEAAQAAAPRLTGRLKERIQTTAPKNFRGRLGITVGPVRFSKREKNFPFYGKFQELGWKATGRATRKSAKNPRAIPGKHFLRNAGTQNFTRAEQIFAARVFKGFAEVQSAGEAAGLV
jgi:HK97 gp10 family phage protein